MLKELAFDWKGALYILELNGPPVIFHLEGEAGVERLDAAFARIREEELDRLPSWKEQIWSVLNMLFKV